MAGRKPDPFSTEGAARIAAELEQYTKQGSSRDQRRHYLAQWVQLLDAKGCSISEIVRVLRKVGVNTTRETVSKMVNQTGPAAPPQVSPPPPPPPPQRPPQARVDGGEPAESLSVKPAPRVRPHSGLRNVKL